MKRRLIIMVAALAVTGSAVLLGNPFAGGGLGPAPAAAQCSKSGDPYPCDCKPATKGSCTAEETYECDGEISMNPSVKCKYKCTYKKGLPCGGSGGGSQGSGSKGSKGSRRSGN